VRATQVTSLGQFAPPPLSPFISCFLSTHTSTFILYEFECSNQGRCAPGRTNDGSRRAVGAACRPPPLDGLNLSMCFEAFVSCREVPILLPALVPAGNWKAYGQVHCTPSGSESAMYRPPGPTRRLLGRALARTSVLAARDRQTRAGSLCHALLLRRGPPQRGGPCACRHSGARKASSLPRPSPALGRSTRRARREHGSWRLLRPGVSAAPGRSRQQLLLRSRRNAASDVGSAGTAGSRPGSRGFAARRCVARRPSQGDHPWRTKRVWYSRRARTGESTELHRQACAERPPA
jgi:hypothetical protein